MHLRNRDAEIAPGIREIHYSAFTSTGHYRHHTTNSNKPLSFPTTPKCSTCMEWLPLTYNNVLAVWFSFSCLHKPVLVLISAWFAQKFCSSAFFTSFTSFKGGSLYTVINPVTKSKLFNYKKLHMHFEVP